MLITDDDLFDNMVIHLISDYHTIQESLQAKLLAEKAEYDSVDSNVYNYMTLSSPLQSCCVPSHSNMGCSQPEALAIRKEENKQHIREELFVKINRLEKEHNDNRRIHLLYMDLPMYHHIVLYQLYERHVPWDELRVKLRIRNATLIKLRKDAFSLIRAGFFSRLTMQQLISLRKNTQYEKDLRITWNEVLREYGKEGIIAGDELVGM